MGWLAEGAAAVEQTYDAIEKEVDRYSNKARGFIDNTLGKYGIDDVSDTSKYRSDYEPTSGEAREIHPFQFIQFTPVRFFGVPRWPLTAMQLAEKGIKGVGKANKARTWLQNKANNLKTTTHSQTKKGKSSKNSGSKFSKTASGKITKGTKNPKKPGKRWTPGPTTGGIITGAATLLTATNLNDDKTTHGTLPYVQAGRKKRRMRKWLT